MITFILANSPRNDSKRRGGGGGWGGGGMALSKPSFESHFKSLPLFLQEFEKSNACKISNIVYLKEF